MTRKDLLSVGTWAAASFGLAMAALLPTTLTATEEPAKVAAVNATPTLALGDVKLSVRMVEPTEEDKGRIGSPRRFELVAVNTGSSPASFEVTLSASGLSFDDVMSRVPRPVSSSSTPMWTGTIKESVDAGQTKVIGFVPETNRGRLLNITMASGGKSIVAFGVPVVVNNGDVLQVNNGAVLQVNNAPIQLQNAGLNQVVAPTKAGN